MKYLVIRGRRFQIDKFNPKVYELAAQLVFKKDGPGSYYRGGCDAIERACIALKESGQYADRYSDLLRYMFRPSPDEFYSYTALNTFPKGEYGIAYFWGSTNRIKNQRARSTAMLTLANMLKGLK